MKKLIRLLPLLLLLHTGAFVSAQQLLTFQRTLGGDVTFQTFDGKQLPDGGFAVVGFLNDPFFNTTRVALVKLGCLGETEWVKTFGTTSTVQNISPRLAVMADSSVVMVANVGIFQAYNILVARVKSDGTTLWRKVINEGLGDDGGNAVYPTADGGVVVAGYTNSYGQETPGGSFRDAYLLKLSGNGDLEWSRTFGTKQAYDEASGVIQTADGGYAVCGRMIDRGAFHAFLLKTAPDGAPEFLQTYGDTLHANWSFAVRQLQDGGYAMVGSSTLLKNSFQDWADNFVLRTNATGDTLWTRVFRGTPDRFENASSLVVDEQENLLVGVATASYPNVGFVPNKHVLAKFTTDGDLLQALTFNQGSSHYPNLVKPLDAGYMLTGFSNFYTPEFGGLVIKTDQNLNPGCFISDVTTLTAVDPGPFKVRSPVYLVAAGANIKNFTLEFTDAVTDSVLCQQNPPAPIADSSFPMDRDSFCLGDTVTFVDGSVGNIISYTWTIGDSIYTIENPLHQFEVVGDVNVKLLVSDGCRQDSFEFSVIVRPLPVVDLGPDSTLCQGDTFRIQPAGSFQSFVWSDGSTEPFLDVTLAGEYFVAATQDLCQGFDTIQIGFIDCDTVKTDLFILPNAFTPNGDSNNDVWQVTHGTDYTLLSLDIYNRWGEIVFSSQETGSFVWDGRHNDQDQASDVYIYILRLRLKDEEQLHKGDITLLR